MENKNTKTRVLKGVVTSDKMTKTVVVEVSHMKKHPKYKKYMKKSQKFLVHDPGNTSEIGQKVMIRETKPISRRKHFILVAQN